VGSAAYNYANLSNIKGGASVNAPWGTIQTIDPNLQAPYSEQFSFTIQRDLPWKMFGEGGYVGSLGRHLLAEPDINQPSWWVLGNSASTANYNSLRPYAGYSAIQQFMSAATSNYHAMQLRLARRAGAVKFTAAYTWSKNLTDASSDTANDLNAFNLKTMYGPANSTSSAGSMDVRHAFVGTYVLDLPRLRKMNPILRTPIGGWQLSGIIRLQTGFYYTVTGNTSILGSRVADYLGGPTVLPNPGPNGWFNPAAFAAAPQGRWGTSGAGNIEGPGMQVFNLSLTKFFDITERIRIRFRADFVNAFNHTNFNGFASTSISSSSFGTISSAFPARNIQLGAKLQF
jgi:hypothetical protein